MTKKQQKAHKHHQTNMEVIGCKLTKRLKGFSSDSALNDLMAIAWLNSYIDLNALPSLYAFLTSSHQI